MTDKQDSIWTEAMVEAGEEAYEAKSPGSIGVHRESLIAAYLAMDALRPSEPKESE